MNGAIKRLQGEKFADFAARQKAAQEAERKLDKKLKQIAAKPKRRSPRKPKKSTKAADIVDGYNLDDLGESRD